MPGLPGVLSSLLMSVLVPCRLNDWQTLSSWRLIRATGMAKLTVSAIGLANEFSGGALPVRRARPPHRRRIARGWPRLLAPHRAGARRAGTHGHPARHRTDQIRESADHRVRAAR